MSHPIPDDVARLAARLRLAADEMESAARYGVPVPFCLNVAGGVHVGVHAAMTPEEFDAWMDYVVEASEVDVTRWTNEGFEWFRVEVDVNGLPLTMSTKRELVASS